jgi:hypothetical protein
MEHFKLMKLKAYRDVLHRDEPSAWKRGTPHTEK